MEYGAHSGSISEPEVEGGESRAHDKATEADVIIVGGGPSGSTAAIALRRANPSLRVVLIDRAKFPRDKACGDGIGPGAIKVLHDLDAIGVVDGAERPLTVRVTGPSGTKGSAEGPTIAGRELTGRVLARRDFDWRLLGKAKEVGVDVREGIAFTSMALSGFGRVVKLRDVNSGDAFEVKAKLVVGADGAQSRVRDAFGIDKQEQRSTHFAVRSYIKYCDPESSGPNSNPLRIDFTGELLPAYGWIFPIGPGMANVGVGLPMVDMRERKVKINRLLDDYLELLSNRGFDLKEPEDRRSALLPHARQLGPIAQPRGALIGDAAGMINPLSGEGIAYGMVAGKMLADSLSDWDGRSAAILERSLQVFERQFKSRFRAHLLSCLAGHLLLSSAYNAKVVVGAAGSSEEVMADAALMLFAEGRMHANTVTRIGFHAISRALHRR